MNTHLANPHLASKTYIFVYTKPILFLFYKLKKILGKKQGGGEVIWTK